MVVVALQHARRSRWDEAERGVVEGRAHDGICTWQSWATGGREGAVGVEVKTGSETSQSRTEGKVTQQSRGGARPRQKAEAATGKSGLRQLTVGSKSGIF